MAPFSCKARFPFLVGQESGDGNLSTHIEKEIARALSPLLLCKRIVVHPIVERKPFFGIHVFRYVVHLLVRLPLRQVEPVHR
ncbi:hypothetical protein MF271_05990 [Deinococcus sp. KNUC1210]|uniref:hypothetical protein n=1 Tax=Deinococcus sp. KNUC1210 TaxID=2917691 RepID=UPI001EEFB041|nr:hypothetical protein [Deinococcus sp. KNUC1210]ULH16165.1 hypothetical protein MF271_05990 [Deinococcus sp. KNUC1210]